MWEFRLSTLANLSFILLVAINFSVSHVSASKQLQNETDRLALLEFKRQIYDDPFAVLNSWNHSQHHCEWEGVTCSSRHNQRVMALTLRDKHLSGTISPHVGNLSFMRFIHLEENQFRGEIPQEFGRLFRLRVLNLSGNALGGKIPANLSYCSEMTAISLMSNRLEGKIPIDQLSNLKKLELFNIYSNNLTGEIPSSIGNLSALITLVLSFNNLGGYLPKEMGLLKKLAILRVGGNKLSGIIPASIFNSSTIILFSVAANSFHGNLPTNIGFTLPNLVVLAVGENKFHGKLPTSITNASGLVTLDLSRNKFQGQVPANLGDLTNLQIINLSINLFGNNSTGDLDFVASLTNCSNLTSLSLSGNNFGGKLPKVMANLSNQLTELYLGGNQLSGTIPEGFGNLVNLYLLTFETNSLSGHIPRDFGKLQNLQLLSLAQNELSGQIVSTLCNATALYRLEFSFNQFEGGNIFDNVLMNCQNLQVLGIYQNNFTGIISPHFLETHSSLMHLMLGENSFSGSLPPEVGKLIHLVDLDVSQNQLAGGIPISLADCTNLENLYMQSNFFQGTIPPNLASLKSIRQLDLSSNNLTGRIPKELQKLQFLSYLNLSYNDIEGEIPNTGIFSNASQISLTGNNKLCGGIPELEFPPCPVIKGKTRGKLKVIILLSIVLPAMLLVLGALLLSFLVHRKRERRMVAGFSSMPTRIDELLRLSYHELLCATSGFSPENLIGSGNFGAVYKGRLEKLGNKLVAVKVLDLQKNGASKSFEAECKTLRNIRHRNLISITSYCSSIDSRGDEFKALVYEFMENGNLDLWLHPETTDQATSSRSLNLLQKLNIAIDVASAMQYLHDHCDAEIVHCDLKPSNILLDNDLVAHVGDFGLARHLPKPNNRSSDQEGSSTIAIKGTIGYAPPEYGLGVAASTLGDVYSYGILLLEMITRKRPIDDMFMDELDLHNYVNRALPGQVYEIVDPLLLSKAGDENKRMNPGGDKIDGEREMECVISLVKIGLKCSEKSPNDRMHMNEVVRKLHHIKDVFLGVSAYRKNLEA
ncbi:probable LRR receptor-like serine/threonine-protein kinase At3g47570 isoform X1 [Coffea eugenioides]|uniref:probable LRR receptor-like serine/threonine-protein kinase At3g47570 isoform X1 n=1 Tax=Coffea eugenioides TaxID=49369 RepID=UPI000F609645|nr:probable LRR receptor-like serine/threonine-protein kinase At3g47570 isoform X1 [Coffea eugenioides]XP_027156028.1 probable LRR receptor-like serine/threonine-protein kinase At3g47570 isoform X1 [Coffea eugenioides]